MDTNWFVIVHGWIFTTSVVVSSIPYGDAAGHSNSQFRGRNAVFGSVYGTFRKVQLPSGRSYWLAEGLFSSKNHVKTNSCGWRLPLEKFLASLKILVDFPKKKSKFSPSAMVAERIKLTNQEIKGAKV
jgi:hypothetical protein